MLEKNSFVNWLHQNQQIYSVISALFKIVSVTLRHSNKCSLLSSYSGFKIQDSCGLNFVGNFLQPRCCWFFLHFSLWLVRNFRWSSWRWRQVNHFNLIFVRVSSHRCLSLPGAATIVTAPARLFIAELVVLLFKSSGGIEIPSLHMRMLP